MASYFEQRGGTYTPVNGVLLPDLVLEAPPPGPLGKFGRMRKRYLEQRRDGTFSTLVLTGKLTEHLMEVDQAARDQLEWLRRMNSTHHRAEEIVKNELIYN